MLLIKTSAEIQKRVQTIRCSGDKIGFVPTMGALHTGHLSLIDQAKKENDFVIVSIFVNPTQFNNQLDFDNYPNKTKQDLDLLEEHGVDCVFLPIVQEMYNDDSVLSFDFGYLENIMEGAFRPGHFNGVATIVAKFFNIVNPHKAYFGQKDIQQVAVIKSLVAALSFQLEIIVVPTCRALTGLALSSRNQRLTAQEKKIATMLYQTLVSVRDGICSGDLFDNLKKKEIAFLEQNYGFRVEYLELVESSTLKNCEMKSGGEFAICVAAYLGDVRLIDNLVFVSE